jgi:nucleotide-binding universal stress UspA family protein
MFRLHSILCPTDFSPCAAAAVEYAAQLARRVQAEIALVHVVPEFDHYIVGLDMIAVLPQLIDQSCAKAEDELHKMRKQFADLTVHTEVRRGSPHESILTAAKGMDLIVIGTHGRTGIKHVMLGSVAERIVRYSTVPVLTVRRPA